MVLYRKPILFQKLKICFFFTVHRHLGIPVQVIQREWSGTFLFINLATSKGISLFYGIRMYQHSLQTTGPHFEVKLNFLYLAHCSGRPDGSRMDTYVCVPSEFCLRMGRFVQGTEKEMKKPGLQPQQSWGLSVWTTVPLCTGTRFDALQGSVVVAPRARFGGNGQYPQVGIFPNFTL